jgi:hypothetical protein
MVREQETKCPNLRAEIMELENMDEEAFFKGAMVERSSAQYKDKD